MALIWTLWMTILLSIWRLLLRKCRHCKTTVSECPTIPAHPLVLPFYCQKVACVGASKLVKMKSFKSIHNEYAPEYLKELVEQYDKSADWLENHPDFHHNSPFRFCIFFYLTASMNFRQIEKPHGPCTVTHRKFCKRKFILQNGCIFFFAI